MKKLVTLTLSAFILLGCSPIDELKTFVDSNQVCESLDATTITNLVGEPYETTPMEDLDFRTGGCAFMNTQDDPLFARNFNIIARKTETAAVSADEFNRAVAFWENNQLANKEFRDLTGLGTEAFWVYGETTSQIIAYEDDTFAIISFAHLKDSDDELLAKAVDITKTVLQKVAENAAALTEEE
ncbi:MAG: hypothetical protein R3B71_03700 [Candidatus Gracilibacteria bacterium]|nr:hypothetical protein [Candidatus Peregrinibacteria bacterium]